MTKIAWKNGRGKLGVFKPVLGRWIAKADSELGPVVCRREFTMILDGKFIQLDAQWHIGGEASSSRSYLERAIFGVDDDGELHFWSFTSDGKRSTGWQSLAPDIHPNALCFSSDMPAGRARQIYWPHEQDGFRWAVESRSKKGWNRFTDHHYQPHLVSAEL